MLRMSRIHIINWTIIQHTAYSISENKTYSVTQKINTVGHNFIKLLLTLLYQVFMGRHRFTLFPVIKLQRLDLLTPESSIWSLSDLVFNPVILLQLI